MDLVSWTFNTIDKIFSTMRMEQGAPSCPDGTYPVGYILDSWKEWNIIYCSQLSVEDVEDTWIFGIMISGFLLIGVGGLLLFWKFGKSGAIGMAPELKETTQTLLEVNRKLEVLTAIPVLARTIICLF